MASEASASKSIRNLVAKARQNATREKVEHLVEFRAQDAFTVDVSPATVVTLYMLPEFNAKLRPILDRQLRPGSRVVSHDYPIEGWVPDKVDIVKGDLCARPHGAALRNPLSKPGALGQLKSAQVVKLRRIRFQNFCLGSVADIFALAQHPCGEAFAVAMRHIRAEHDLALAHQF